MKRRKGILRISAFFLLLIFSQKIGIGLTLHNFFHSQSYTGDFSKPDKSGKEISFACSCIDDFLAPFTPAEEPVVVVPELKWVDRYAAVLTTYSNPSCRLVTLRGPPAAC